MSEYMKRIFVMQYDEVQFFKDGEWFDSEIRDAITFDMGPLEPMTEEEIEDRS